MTHHRARRPRDVDARRRPPADREDVAARVSPVAQSRTHVWKMKLANEVVRLRRANQTSDGVAIVRFM